MNLTDIRQSLADDLNDVPGLQGVAFVPDSISTVTACVIPGEPYVNYHDTFPDGSIAGMTVTVNVLLLVPRNLDFDWQEKLDVLCSTGTVGSAVDAIESGAARSVLGAGSWGTTTVGAAEYGSARLRVEILDN